MRRLLAYRDARLFLGGQSLSLLGDTALWLALTLQAFTVGLAGVYLLTRMSPSRA